MFVFFGLTIVGIIYGDWIKQAFRRGIKIRRFAKFYKGEALLKTVIDEMNEQNTLI